MDDDQYPHRWHDRATWLPFDPPGLRGRFAYPGRCWEVRWRDRLAWRLFCLVAHHDHASVVWGTFRRTRKASETRWSFGEEGAEADSIRRPDLSLVDGAAEAQPGGCQGCGREQSCAPLWPEQRKCCPDCTCGQPPAPTPLSARSDAVDE